MPIIRSKDDLESRFKHLYFENNDLYTVPQETMPTTAHRPDSILYIRGPPESP